MTTAILIALLAATPRPSSAQAPADLYNQGNRLYAEGSYQSAVESYHRALGQGLHPDLLYNLGNAYFKTGQVGWAIISYRRAAYLAPRDRDISANLTYARNYRIDKVLSPPGPLEAGLNRTLHLLSEREASLLAGTAFLLAAVLLAFYIVFRKRYLLFMLLLPALGFLFCLAAQQAWAGQRGSRPAVVVVPEATALAGPGQDFKEILLLHDGTEVTVREARDQYLLVQLPGGSGGWVRKGTVEPVF